MVSEQKHIIDKVVVEVNTNSRATAFKLKDKLDVFLREDVLPYVEEYIDGIASDLGHKIVQIPKIEIEINSSSSRQLEELKSALKSAIEKELSSMIAEPSTQNGEERRVLSREDYYFNSLINFLKTGTTLRLDPNGEHQFETEHLKGIVSVKQFSRQFINALEDQKAQVRLINQFSDDQIRYLLKSTFLTPIKEKSSNSAELTARLFSSAFSQQIKRANLETRQILWQLIINYLLFDHGKNKVVASDYISQQTEKLKRVSPDKGFQTALENVLKDLNISSSKFKQSNDKTEQKKASDEVENQDDVPDFEDELPLRSDELEQGIIVENAGLILLHPYLSQFFRTCSLLDENDQLTDKVLSAHVLHYLATKQENQFENHMVFEKLLSGIPQAFSINRHVALSKAIKRESEDLLSAVIQNWGALKNASPDLLRHEFLMRSGKIFLKNETLKLVVERKTQDILIDKLPWSIGYCKLPWLKQLITTDW